VTIFLKPLGLKAGIDRNYRLISLGKGESNIFFLPKMPCDHLLITYHQGIYMLAMYWA